MFGLVPLAAAKVAASGGQRAAAWLVVSLRGSERAGGGCSGSVSGRCLGGAFQRCCRGGSARSCAPRPCWPARPSPRSARSPPPRTALQAVQLPRGPVSRARAAEAPRPAAAQSPRLYTAHPPSTARGRIAQKRARLAHDLSQKCHKTAPSPCANSGQSPRAGHRLGRCCRGSSLRPGLHGSCGQWFAVGGWRIVLVSLCSAERRRAGRARSLGGPGTPAFGRQPGPNTASGLTAGAGASEACSGAPARSE